MSWRVFFVVVVVCFVFFPTYVQKKEKSMHDAIWLLSNFVDICMLTEYFGTPCPCLNTKHPDKWKSWWCWIFSNSCRFYGDPYNSSSGGALSHCLHCKGPLEAHPLTANGSFQYLFPMIQAFWKWWSVSKTPPKFEYGNTNIIQESLFHQFLFFDVICVNKLPKM